MLLSLLLLSLTLNIIEGLDDQSSLISQEAKAESHFYDDVRDIIPAIYPMDLFIMKKEEMKEEKEGVVI